MRGTPYLAEGSSGTGSAAATLVVPVLSSRPTATAVLFMDFDGETVSDPNWNGGQTIDAKPSTLTAEEIAEVWRRVSEDFVGFDIDITTDVRRYSSAAPGHRMRCIVTPTDLAARGAGGVAYLNSFSEAGKTMSDTIPCWVFNPGVIGVSEAVSHELGHTLGLRHDGRTSPPEEYFMGHGEGTLSWAPIMGVGYYKNVVQWSKGEYAAANNHEDDIAVIASTLNAFGFSADEAGSMPESATTVQPGTLGEVDVQAVIQSSADTDVFRVSIPAGRLRLTATPTGASPNLDAVLTLKDSAGATLTTANPEAGLAASLDFAVAAAGSYFVSVAGTGHGDVLLNGYSSYGSTGAYALTGQIPVGDGVAFLPAGQEVAAPRSIAFRHQIRAGNAPTSFTATDLPAGLALDSTTGVISGIPTAPTGVYTVSLSVTNALGTRTGSLAITLSVEPAPVIAIEALRLARVGRAFSLSVVANALPQSYRASGLPPGLTIDAASGLIAGTPSTLGVYRVTLGATNATGTGQADFTMAVVSAGETVGAGYEHGLYVRGDGTLWSAGSNQFGQLGDGSTVNRAVPVQVATGVRATAAGSYHSLFIKTDGSLWGMGMNWSGQLGGEGQANAPVQIATSVVASAGGYGHTLFIKTDGTLWGVGGNSLGQLGDGTTTSRSSAVQIDTPVVAVAASYENSAYVKADGSLWTMGGNSTGQLGDGTTVNRATPVRIADNVFSVAAGSSFLLFVKNDGTLWRTGLGNWIGSSSTGGASDYLPHQIASGVTKIAAAGGAALFTTTDGSLWLLGSNGRTFYTSATKVANEAASFALGAGFLLHATADGKFWGSGSNSARAFGDGVPVERTSPLAVASEVSAAVAGQSYSLWVKTDGSLWGVGGNTNGQLGDRSNEDRGTAVRVAEGVLTAAAGSSHSLFLKAGGDLWGMGYLPGSGGWLSPTRLEETARTAAAGGQFSLWVRADRTLWGVGNNFFGVLGDGSTTQREQPVFMQRDVAGLAAGSYHALWWTTDGVLWGAGYNQEGQLGDGTAINRARSVQLATGVRKAVTGSAHSLYVSTNDELFATGANVNGQLGEGNPTHNWRAVSGGTGVADVAANDDGSYFVKRDGTLLAMGRLFGSTPKRIARGVTAVAARGGHALILKTDQSLWAIGRDDSGQLGDGATLYYNTPTEVRLGRPGVLAATLPFETSVGGNVTFSVTATGEGALGYQWRKNGIAISGATGATYVISSAGPADGGSYDVVVSNSVGSATSTATPLTVLGVAPVLRSATAVSTPRLQPFTFQVQAENEPTSFTAEGLPTGLTLAPGTGIISGVPTAPVGPYNVSLTASNVYGTTSGTLTLTLTAAAVPQIALSRTLVVRRGVASSFDVTATSSPQSFGAVGLPAGLAIDATTGTISGTPTAGAGLYAATISAVNEGGTGTLTVRVAVVPEWQDRAGGHETSFVVDPQGILWAAGDNQFGQLGDGSTTNRSTPVRIADHVVSVAGGVTHTLFVKGDGTLWGAGWNVQGLFGLGDRTQRNSPAQIDTDVVAAAVGFNHIVYLKSDGTAWAAGYNYAGQFGDSTQMASVRPVQVATQVAAVAAGAEHSLFLHTDGTLWAAGANASGQLGDGTFSDHVAPIQIAANVTAIAASASASYFVKSDQTLWGAGFNGMNQLKTRTDSDSFYEATPVKLSEGALAVSGGMNQSVYLASDRKLWGRGMNQWAQLGDQTQQFSLEPRVVATGVTFGATGYTHSLWGKPDGGVWVVGLNSAGQTADGFEAKQFTPLRIAPQVKQAAAGESHSLFVTADGVLWATGYNALGSLGDGTRNDAATPVKIAQGVARAATGWWHSGFVKVDGTLWMMGNNGDGELGNGSTASDGVARPFQVMEQVAAVSTGAWHTVVLKADKTVWAMGWNGQGQLGDGTYIQKTLPTQILSEVIEVAAGSKHTLFLKTDGSLWGTGDNTVGQLGDGTTAGRNAPALIATNVAHIAAGGWHSLWVKTDGTLWGAGYNSYGELGDGTSTSRLSPVQIDSNVQTVSGGAYHTSYIKQDGSIWMTGRNYEGQLGDGAVAGSAQVAAQGTAGDFVGVRAVESEVWISESSKIARTPGVGSGQAGRFVMRPTASESAATTGQGKVVEPTVMGFLQNSSPQVRYQPVRIATGGLAVAAGGYHSLYVRRDGSLWAMGQALYGRLGHGGGLLQWDARQIRFGSLAILGQSIPFAVRLAQPVDFSVSAAGDGTLTYQWRKNGVAISGATGSHYFVSSVAAADGGVYDVVVTNALGTKACTAVNVSVIDAPPAIGGTLTVSVPRLSDGFEYRISANNDATTFAASGLPAGLSIDAATGVISGRVDAAVGPVSVTLTATNANGSSTAELTLNVTAQAVPAVTSATTILARHGQQLRYAITASNSPAGFSAQSLPAGLTVDAATGVISGKVTSAAGDFVATVGASNSSGQGTAQVKFVVLPVWAGIAASNYSLVVDDQGTLWSMGENGNGQLGSGSKSDRSTPKPLAQGVVAVAAGSSTSLFLKTDGSLWAAGYLTSYGGDVLAPVQIASRVRALAGGLGHVLYVDWDGVLWTCGLNFYGQLGDGTTTERATPVAIATEVASVAAGGYTSLFVKRDGTLWGMGSNMFGQLGNGTKTDQLTPIQITTNVATASSSYSHTLIVKNDGTLWACGDNWIGRLGDGTTEPRTTPVLIRSGVIAAWAGQGSLCLTQTGELWSSGESGPMGWTTVQPKIVATSIVGAAEGLSHVLLIDSAGKILMAGDNSHGQLGESTLSVNYPVKVADEVVRVSGASDHTMWIKQDGTLWGTGDPYSGQRGVNYYSSLFDPAKAETGGRVTDVAAGDYFTVYLRQDGTMWGMGSNGVGQLTGSNTAVYTAMQMATDVVTVAAGRDSAFYVSSARELWGTGGNYSGNLGDGSTTNRTSFGKVTGAVQSVTTSNWNTLILKTDGTLWGTGSNWQSQQGGTVGPGSATPIQLASDVVAAAAGGYHTLYVSRGGALWAMGGNASGQLGEGTTQNRTAPVQVATGVQAVAAADESSYFLKTDGTVWAMGKNGSGELGDGSQQRRLQPVLVATGVGAISAAPQASYIIKRDRTLWSTGGNYHGRLGVHTIPSRAELVELVLGRPVVETLSIPVAANLGGTAQFTVTASGEGEFTYQWRKNGQPIAGATGAGYFIGVVTAQDGGVYDVAIAGPRGSALSDSASFTVLNAAPVITSVLSASVRGGQTFDYRLTANNDAYKFTAMGLPAGLGIDGTTGRIAGTAANVGGAYAVTLTAANDAGSTSGTLQLEVTAPPQFTTHPQNRSADPGASTSFTAAVSGWPAPTFQWQLSANSGASWTNLSEGGAYTGATTATLGLSGLTVAMQGYQYRCVTTNNLGTATSNAATLTINVSIGLVTHPLDQTVLAGSDTTFTVVATGTPPPTTQWQVSADAGTTWTNLANTAPYAGVTSGTLAITGASASMNGYRFRAVATNSAGTVTSKVATLTVNVAPTITTQPATVVVATGGEARFTVAASGLPTPALQWQVSADAGSTWSNLAASDVFSGVTSPTLTITGATLALGRNQYRCEVTNAAGRVASQIAIIMVIDTPLITSQPAPQTVTPGSTVSFTVSVLGTPLPLLQWQVTTDGATWTNLLEGGAYSGVHASTLVVTGATTAMSGRQFRCLASNPAGTTASAPAQLTVQLPPAVTVAPTSQTVVAGTDATFTFTFVGDPTPALLWELSVDGGTSWRALADAGSYRGVTTASLKIAGATVEMNGYLYRCIGSSIAGGFVTSVASLTVTNTATFAGVYFGELGVGRGRWAMTVNVDGTAVFIAYLSQQKTAVKVQLTIGADGAFTVNSTELLPLSAPASRALSVGGGSTKRNQTTPRDFVLSGRIGSGGIVTGQMAGLNELFSGAPDTVTGSSPAGFYAAGQTDGTGSVYAVVAPSGQALVVTVTPNSVDGASGMVSSGGQLATTTLAGGQLRVAIGTGASQIAATITPAGATTPIVFGPSGSASHAVSGSDGYLAAGTISITNTLTYTGGPTRLTWQVLLPDGWSFVSDAGSPGDTKPTVGTTGSLEWAWSVPPASPVTFTYTLAVASSSTGSKDIAAIVGLQSVGSPVQLLVKPDPLTIAEGRSYHAADTNHDWKLSLLELARVIELYNTRNGATRTGCYGVQSGSEDGFASDRTRAANSTATLTRYHSADTDRNGRLSLLELARVIELYNQRTAGVRTGRYRVRAGSEDGYATEP